MPQTVVYRGSREELQGQSFVIPDGMTTTATGNSIAVYIEKLVDDEAAIKAAEQEATARRQQALAQKQEANRAAVSAINAEKAQAEGQQGRDEEFRVELNSVSNALLAGAAAEVSRYERTEAKQLEWEDRGEVVARRNEETASKAEEQVLFALATTEQADLQLHEHMAQQEQRISTLESELRAYVQSDECKGGVGATGGRGLPGSGLGLVDAPPDTIDQQSLGQRFFGRRVVAGDVLMQQQSDQMVIWRTPNGTEWVKSGVLLNKQELVSNSWRAHADVKTSFTSSTTIKSGGGGSTPLATQLVNGAAGGASQRIGDGAAYGAELERTGQYARACEAILRVTALDGPDAGKSDYARYDLLVEENAAESETVSAMLGTLNLGVSLRLISTGSGYPAAWAPKGALSSTTHTPVIEMQVDSNPSQSTQLAIEGAITWVLPTDGGKPLTAAW